MNQPTKKKANHGQPYCRKCDSTDLEFTYTETEYGREIDEERVLQAACYYLGQYIGQVATDDSGFDTSILAHMNIVLADLAGMMRVREEEEEKANAGSAEEAQS